MATIPFTDNYQDLSSGRGFQFKFMCQKCGNGYMSTFKTNKMGAVAGAASAAASLLGGIFGRAAAGAQQLESMVAGPAHDAALHDAVDEIRPMFKQCTRCGNWVCEPVCWNKKAGLCEGCAPDMNEEVAAAQAQAARDQVFEQVKSVNFVGDRDLSQVNAATCAKCGAGTGGKKFCPECGTPTAAKKKCGACNAEAEGSPKFCPDCGKPMS